MISFIGIAAPISFEILMTTTMTLMTGTTTTHAHPLMISILLMTPLLDMITITLTEMTMQAPT